MIARADLHRDESGRVVLTTEQAELVARILAYDWAPGTDTPEDAVWWAFFDIEKQSPDGCLLAGNKTDALALWVMRWAPVVAAASAAVDARAAAISGGNWTPGAPMRRLEDAEAVLAASVGVARTRPERETQP